MKQHGMPNKYLVAFAAPGGQWVRVVSEPPQCTSIAVLNEEERICSKINMLLRMVSSRNNLLRQGSETVRLKKQNFSVRTAACGAVQRVSVLVKHPR